MSVKGTRGYSPIPPATSETPRVSISSMPDELTLNIIQQARLSPTQTLTLRRVNKQFTRVCLSNELWKDLVAPRPMRPASNGGEPPLIHDIWAMPQDERRILALIWQPWPPQDISRLSFNLLRMYPNNRQIAYALLQKQGISLRYASAEFQRDKDLAVAAVKQNGLALQYVAPELQANEEVVLAAVRQDGAALQWAAPELQANKEIVLAAVRQNGAALQWAAPELQADKEVVLAAVSQDGKVLSYAAPALKGDKEVVLAAVRQASSTFSHELSALQGNPYLALPLIMQYWSTCGHASDALKSDPDVLRVMKEGQPVALDTLRNNPAFTTMVDRLIESGHFFGNQL